MTAPAVRYDFEQSEVPALADDQARSQAIAAQKAWRLSELVGSIGVTQPPAPTGARLDPSRSGDLLEAVKIVRGDIVAP